MQLLHMLRFPGRWPHGPLPARFHPRWRCARFTVLIFLVVAEYCRWGLIMLCILVIVLLFVFFFNIPLRMVDCRDMVRCALCSRLPNASLCSPACVVYVAFATSFCARLVLVCPRVLAVAGSRGSLFVSATFSTCDRMLRCARTTSSHGIRVPPGDAVPSSFFLRSPFRLLLASTVVHSPALLSALLQPRPCSLSAQSLP